MDIHYYVPIEIMRSTKGFLVNEGKKDNEAYVLWKGKQQSNTTYSITGMVIPEQRAICSPFGYSFDLSQESIAEVLKTLRQTNEIGLIQVHSHPGYSALHSERDDKLSLLGRKGSLSIVLPFFGNIIFEDFSETKVHILTDIQQWQILSTDQVNQTLTVVR